MPFTDRENYNFISIYDANIQNFPFQIMRYISTKLLFLSIWKCDA